jgi:hypothetical protein
MHEEISPIRLRHSTVLVNQFGKTLVSPACSATRLNPRLSFARSRGAAENLTGRTLFIPNYVDGLYERRIRIIPYARRSVALGAANVGRSLAGFALPFR